MNPYLNTAIKAILEAGKIVTRGYARRDLIEIREKGLNDFVTNIDIESEDNNFNHKKSYPHHSVLSEERKISIENENDYQWIIDPLDGTMNFIHGFPYFSISIALVYKKKIEIAAIFDPITENLFTAVRGQGALKNKYKSRVNRKLSLANSLIGTSFQSKNQSIAAAYYKTLSRITTLCHSVRKTGSAALDLAYVADGSLGGYFALGLSKWDIAAGILLVKESGGIITGTNGDENYFETGNIVTGPPNVCKELIKILARLF